jgi:hypothetical protein
VYLSTLSGELGGVVSSMCASALIARLSLPGIMPLLTVLFLIRVAVPNVAVLVAASYTYDVDIASHSFVASGTHAPGHVGQVLFRVNVPPPGTCTQRRPRTAAVRAAEPASEWLQPRPGTQGQLLCFARSIPPCERPSHRQQHHPGTPRGASGAQS